MPVEGKRRLAAAGNAMHDELSALTDYLAVHGRESRPLSQCLGEQDALSDEPSAQDGSYV